MMRLKLKFKSDCNGRPLFVGDKVRVCKVPDLKGMSEVGIRESLPVFRYAVGKIAKIGWFDNGLAQLDIVIPVGSHKGFHGIYIEPWLLKKV